MTLLDMVQNIMSAMTAEEVNSISDTVESEQVAFEIKTTYYEKFGNIRVPEWDKLVSFDPLSDHIKYPNVLKFKEVVSEIEWLKYNTGTVADPKNYVDIQYLEPKEFLDKVLSDNTDTQILVEDIHTQAPYYVRSDRNPCFWTTFDNEHVIFDSYNAKQDDSLQQSKTLAFGQVIPEFKLEDTFIPDLPDKMFPEFLAEAKSAAWVNYKGASNTKEEQRSRRQMVRRTQNDDKKRERGVRNFGR